MIGNGGSLRGMEHRLHQNSYLDENSPQTRSPPPKKAPLMSQTPQIGDKPMH